jgi:hypothetical protein
MIDWPRRVSNADDEADRRGRAATEVQRLDGARPSDLELAGIVPRIDDALAFAAESQVLLSRHAETGVDIDVPLAWLPFEMEAITARWVAATAGASCSARRAVHSHQ